MVVGATGTDQIPLDLVVMSVVLVGLLALATRLYPRLAQ
jgi:hypothetical protein